MTRSRHDDAGKPKGPGAAGLAVRPEGASAIVAVMAVILAMCLLVVRMIMAGVMIMAAAAAGAVVVLAPVIVGVLMGVIMGLTMGVLMAMMPVMVRMLMAVTMTVGMLGATAAFPRMIMRVVVCVTMPMSMRVVMVAVIMAAAIVHGEAFGAERPLRRRHRAAEAANGFSHRLVCLDIQHVGFGLRLGMSAARQQCGAQQAGRVFRPDLQHGFGGGAHLHQGVIFQPQGVAVIDLRRRGQRQLDGGAAVGDDGPGAERPGAMVKGDGVGDALRLDGGATGHCCCAWHVGS